MYTLLKLLRTGEYNVNDKTAANPMNILVIIFGLALFIALVLLKAVKVDEITASKLAKERVEIMLLNGECYVKLSDGNFLDCKAYASRRNNLVVKNASKPNR